MPTETLGVTISSQGAWTVTGAADATLAVAAPDDGNTSYVTCATLDEFIFWTVNNTSLQDSNTINSVTVRFRMLCSPLATNILLDVDCNGNDVTDNPEIQTTYADYDIVMTQAPGSLPWTVARLNALIVGAQSTDSVTTRITTVTVIVDYSAAAGDRARSRAAHWLLLRWN